VCSGSLAIKWSISVQDVKVIAINPFDSVINAVVLNRMSMLAIGGQDWALMKLKKSVLGDLR
jgi:precorrin-6B methylase 2